MTFDWTDFAEALRWLLIVLAAGWIFLAWLVRIEYRVALAVLAGLFVVDWAAQTTAHWVVYSESGLPTDVPAFSTFILIGAVLGLTLAAWQAHRNGVSIGAFLDCALVVIIAGAVGARLYHVLMHLDYYTQNSDMITNFGQGGMGIRGGLILGLAALALFSPLRRVSFWQVGDAAAVGMPLALSVGWYGSNLIGANYGAVSDAIWAPDLPDLYGSMMPRFPVQLVAIIFFSLLLIVLAWFSVRRHLKPGVLLLVFLILFGIGNFLLDSQRADETLVWNGWQVDQWIDLLIAVSAAVVLWMRNISFHSMRKQKRVEGES